MENPNAVVKIVEVCKVSPSSPSPSKFSLPLASFDWIYMKLPPLERLFYYSIPHSASDSSLFFHSILIPNLKHSLSLTLNHFLPLAGNLLWPENSPLPSILYSPNHAVSFTVGEADLDFRHVSGSHPREIQHSGAFVPEIPSSDTAVPILAIQVTKFENGGFCIGFSSHHVIFDGRSFNIFVKAWAHVSNLGDGFRCLPPELTPSYERPANMIGNPLDFVPKNRTLKWESVHEVESNWVRATFQLTPTHIQKLKKRVLEKISSSSSSSEELHLSTFVVAYAYVLMCSVKAKQEECKEYIYLVVTADSRGLLNPPVSSNYMGNCVAGSAAMMEAREFRDKSEEEEKEVFANVAKKISRVILELRGRRAVEASKVSEAQRREWASKVEIFMVVDSPKFKFYQTDFGWGNPKKCEVLSFGKNNICLTDSRDGEGGVEAALVFQNHLQLDIFASLFAQGLN